MVDGGAGRSVSSSLNRVRLSYSGMTSLQKLAWAGWVVVLAALAIDALPALSSTPGRDTSAFMYVAQGILKGEVPYLDRWDHKGPVTYVIHALGLLVLGSWGTWLVNSVFLLGSAWLALRLTRLHFGVQAALFSVAIFLVYSEKLGGGGLTEEYALPFQLLAFLLFARVERMERADAWACLAIGALGGIAFLLRANLVGVWLAMGVYWMFRWRDARARIAWSAVGGLSVLAAASVVFVAVGAWAEYWDATMVYNLAYTDPSLYDILDAGDSLVRHMSWVALPLVLGWCAGVWYQFRGEKRGEPFERIWPFVLILGPIEVALSLMSGFGWSHYYLALLPVGVLYFGFLVWLIATNKLVAPAFLTFLLMFAVVNYHHVPIYYHKVSSTVYRIIHPGAPDPVPNADERAAELVKQATDASDTILVWGAQTRIHLLAERDSPTRFFYQYPLLKPGYANEDNRGEFISDVISARPAMIIDTRNGRLPPLDEADRANWQPKPRYEHDPTAFQELFDFVESEYRLVERDEDWFRYRVYMLRAPSRE